MSVESADCLSRIMLPDRLSQPCPYERFYCRSSVLSMGTILRGEGGEARKGGETLLFSPAFLITSYVEWDTFV